MPSMLATARKIILPICASADVKVYWNVNFVTRPRVEAGTGSVKEATYSKPPFGTLLYRSTVTVSGEALMLLTVTVIL